MPSLLQSNYHQPLSLSLHNGYQETLRAPVQKLALDPQPPNWDNVCTLTVEEKKNQGVGVLVGKGGFVVEDCDLLLCLLTAVGIGEIKSNSKSLVSIIQTEWEKRRRDTEKERIKRIGEKKKLLSSSLSLTFQLLSLLKNACLLLLLPPSIQNHYSSAQITTAGGIGLFHMERRYTKRKRRKEKGRHLLTFNMTKRREGLFILQADVNNDIESFHRLIISDHFMLKFVYCWMLWLWKTHQTAFL